MQEESSHWTKNLMSVCETEINQSIQWKIVDRLTFKDTLS